MIELLRDMLHGFSSRGPYPADMKVVACFGALFQGDHLGVELATDSHSNLLCEAGLLGGGSRLRSDFPLAYDAKVDGLVIDDYFCLSRESRALSSDLSASGSVAAFNVAEKVYSREGLIGSDAEDVVGSLVYKVCGAEIDSSLESVDRGVVFAAAPLRQEDEPGFVFSCFGGPSLHLRCFACVPPWIMGLSDDEEAAFRSSE